MFTRSIRFRLQVWQGFLLSVILGGFGVTAYQLHRTNEFGRIDAELEHRVAALVGDLRLRFGPGRPPPEGGPRGFRPGRPPWEQPGEEADPALRHPGAGFQPGPDRVRGPHGPGGRGLGGPGDEPFFLRSLRLSETTQALFQPADPGGFHFGIWSRSGSLVCLSSNAPASLPLPTGGSTRTGIQTRTRGGLREAFQFTGAGDCVLAGRDIRSDLAGLQRFAWGLVVAGVAVLGLGLGGGWVLVGRALRPVADISAAATRISIGRLSERISIESTDNELGRLAAVLNSTFARLETAFAQQRQFTADASHELRTPIAVIMAEAQTALSRDRQAAEYRESLEVCLDAAQQMRRLSQSLLELARFDAGQVAMERAVFDLADPVRAVLDLVRPLARERGLRLEADLQPCPVEGDPDRLARVASNLVTNAIWYNRPEGSLRICTRPAEGMSILEVADTGIGISAEDLAHVFERFYRADRARRRAEGGHGLGLAICRAVVEAHGGTIHVVSTPGSGSTFTVRLPRSAGPTPESAG